MDNRQSVAFKDTELLYYKDDNDRVRMNYVNSRIDDVVYEDLDR